jgi:hypothetical protein
LFGPNILAQDGTGNIDIDRLMPMVNLNPRAKKHFQDIVDPYMFIEMFSQVLKCFLLFRRIVVIAR